MRPLRGGKSERRAAVGRCRGGSGEPFRAEGGEVETGILIGGQPGDDVAGDGGEAEAHHGMAGGDDEVGVPVRATEVGEAIG